MQGDIMKDTENPLFLHVRNKGGAVLDILQLDIIHMGIMCTAFRNRRGVQPAHFFVGGKKIVIFLPGAKTVFVDFIRPLQLRPEVGGIEFTGKIGVSEIHPGIFVHLSPVKFGPVGSLFSQDLGSLVIFCIPNEKGASLPHGIILGFMKRKTAKVAKGAKRLPVIGTHHALRRILHHQKMIFFCNLHDPVHLTGHPGIMNGYDRPGFRCDCRLDLILIQIHRIRSDIDKNRRRSRQQNGICRRGEGETRQNHLIPRLQVT